MSGDTRTLKASCHCGNAKHEITVKQNELPLKSDLCHCTSCRHNTGLLQFAAATLPDEYEPDQSLLDQLTVFDFSENIKHFFCPDCGTGLLSRCIGSGTVEWIIHTGTLEQGDASIYRIDGHIFIEDTLDGGLAEFLTEVDGHPIKRHARSWDSGELPLRWTASERPEVKRPGPDERLHGYCKCRGVEFWLAPPSASASANAHRDEKFPEDRYISPDDEVFWITDNGTKYQAALCPCDSCRLAGNGQPFAQWAYVPTDAVSLDAAGKVPIPENMQWGTLKSCRTANASQHFCGRCGAIVFWNTDARPYLKDFGVGLFDAPDGARAESWFHWRTRELRHREDGLRRAKELTLAVEKGLKEYGENVQSKISSKA